MRVLRSILLCALLLPCVLVGAPAASSDSGASPDARLKRQIAARLAKAGIAKGRYGVSVLERGTGRILAFLGVGESLVPASVAKVLTSASALDHLGPGFRFTTVVRTRGVQDGAQLVGDLRVQGGADPTLAAVGSDRLGVLRRLAKQIAGCGIRRVTGDLILHDAPLDRDYTHSGWSDADKRHPYGAGVGGLSLGEGCLTITVTGASSAGVRAGVSFPATHGPWKVVNKVKTTAGGKPVLGGNWSRGASGSTDVTLIVGGKVPAKKQGAIRVPVPDPVRFFGGAFLSVLRDEGVTVEGGLRIAPPGAAAPSGRELARYESGLADALRTMNVTSRNTYASTLFKLAGARVDGVGSWASGERAVKTMVEARGITVHRTQIVDGSGLSPTNRVTAGLLAQVLHSFDLDPLRGAILRESLPTSGVSGTLRRRLGSRRLKGRVHAKTGTLNDIRVRALAGYIDGKGPDPGAVFAVVLRGRGANHAVIDDIVRLIERR